MTDPAPADLDRQLREVEAEIERLRRLAREQNLPLNGEIAVLEERAEALRRDIYTHPSPWHIVQLARHPQRPRLMDYVSALFTDVLEVHGDRLFRDDPAMFAALARFEGQPVVVVGHHKGKDTKENIARNFGMPYPEGYRKALRAMKLAEKFHAPVIAFVDTPGAFPGDAAEERGQAEAIARNIEEMSRLQTPVIVVITGEGGSGGALAIAVGDVVLMLQYAVYTVISPEGCAAILWHDASRAPEAAAALRLTAADLRDLGVVDEVLPEPFAGAQRDPEAVFAEVREALRRQLQALRQVPAQELVNRRYAKFRRLGVLEESAPAGPRP
ncbi:MAG: acetyl-CoA carboxylase carboxyltransferase subunit alpha [Armatimonadota bacterium]|nr:acetyl-CoA carboxylase carboxyltransferase subunit alpha [Armatimonadota bacterium]MDR7467279.1 acetyl-CoA carboxylase carboxyltransferase subunit alpha [Armatimonadota bacterium]MDR7494540.1 acetyl-CoA carboxylase carboxyltransferase subunit alpha [Armatimonadota bacterium]MDR7499883.1 acetyl-CoA carboxylase carboxyltransferase subunit alpha [Armatimonadota bacterium]MDR7504493.1 acetyl-CoA carboxylase carboxyltransferase subunit alpha [Armatimonadota bacterium]